jgi:predicted dehydrogenase
MAADKLRIAVAGAGSFGREHIATLARRGDVVIVGVSDTNHGAAEEAVARYAGERAFTDTVAMLDAVRPDGLIVATPGNTHVALATAALERNIPVLLEKPVGMRAADADALIAAGERSRAFVLPGHILRFSAPYRRVVAIAQSGELGAILSVTGRNHRGEDHAVRYPDIDPVLMTMVHDIDLSLWITGGVLRSVLAIRRPENTARSETLITGWDSAGAMWHISNAWVLPVAEGAPDRVEIVCERGSVEMDLGVAIRVFGEAPRTIDLTTEPPDDMLATEVEAFLSGVRAGAHPGTVTLQDARNGLAVADAVQESLRTGAVVTL